jgi:hypothetical protein
VAYSRATLSGGSGNDTIVAYTNAGVTGGSGNDRIFLSGQQSGVEFERGDGQDVVSGFTAPTEGSLGDITHGGNAAPLKNLSLDLANLKLSDVSFTHTGDDLVIAIKGTSDSITLKGFAGSDIRGNFLDKDVRIVDDGNGGVSILHPFTGQSVI